MESPRPALHQLRTLKSPAEQQLLRSSCSLGAAALRTTIARSRQLRTEAEVAAVVEHEARLAGAQHPAYPSVAAAGDNCNTIHYTPHQRSQQILSTDLVLVDAGCEYHGYCSDVTRTWPAGGQWSDAQTCIYQAVLEVQEALLASLTPGVTSLDSLYREMQIQLGTRLQVPQATNPEWLSVLCRSWVCWSEATPSCWPPAPTASVPTTSATTSGWTCTTAPGPASTPRSSRARYTGCALACCTATAPCR